MSDFDRAQQYVTKWFDEKESITRSMVSAGQNAINNFDNISEIPEESKAWDWDVVKIIIKAVLTRVPQFKLALEAFDEIVAAGKEVNEKYKISDRVEKGMKVAKAAGIKLEFPKEKPPEVAELKQAAIKARDGLGKWERAAIKMSKVYENFLTIDETKQPPVPGLLTKLQDGIEHKDKDTLQYVGKLYQTMVEILGPVPAYTPDQIEDFGNNIELDLYKQCYAKGAYVYVIPYNPNWRNFNRDRWQVRGIPRKVLDRVKLLTRAAIDVTAVAAWNLPKRIEPCNSCHSPSRMNPERRPMDPLSIEGSGIPKPRDNRLVPVGPDGQVKNFGDWETQRTQQMSEWLKHTSR